MLFYISHPGRGTTDQLLRDLAAKLEDRGVRLAGAVQINEEYFFELAQECGTEITEDRGRSLYETFNEEGKFVYEFEYLPEHQGSSTFVLSLMSNKMNYASLEEFRNDFDLCYAGGDMYPLDINETWLLFASACGTGFADGSGLPNGCAEAKDHIEFSW